MLLNRKSKPIWCESLLAVQLLYVCPVLVGELNGFQKDLGFGELKMYLVRVLQVLVTLK